MKNNSIQLGRLLLTTCRQADGAPIIDSCLTTEDGTKNRFRGWAILIKRPFAFVVAIREKRNKGTRTPLSDYPGKIENE